jgi:hypothetical protein
MTAAMLAQLALLIWAGVIISRVGRLHGPAHSSPSAPHAPSKAWGLFFTAITHALTFSLRVAVINRSFRVGRCPRQKREI